MHLLYPWYSHLLLLMLEIPLFLTDYEMLLCVRVSDYAITKLTLLINDHAYDWSIVYTSADYIRMYILICILMVLLALCSLYIYIQ